MKKEKNKIGLWHKVWSLIVLLLALILLGLAMSSCQSEEEKKEERENLEYLRMKLDTYYDSIPHDEKYLKYSKEEAEVKYRMGKDNLIDKSIHISHVLEAYENFAYGDNTRIASRIKSDFCDGSFIQLVFAIKKMRGVAKAEFELNIPLKASMGTLDPHPIYTLYSRYIAEGKLKIKSINKNNHWKNSNSWFYSCLNNREEIPEELLGDFDERVLQLRIDLEKEGISSNNY